MKITEGQYLDALKTIRDYLKQIKLEIQAINYVANNSREPILSQRLTQCDFSTRLLNALSTVGQTYMPGYYDESKNYIGGRYMDDGLKTVKDLVDSSKNEIHKARNFGKKSMSELDDWMQEFNLSFGMLYK